MYCQDKKEFTKKQKHPPEVRPKSLGDNATDQVLPKHVFVEQGLELRDVALDVRLRAALLERTPVERDQTRARKGFS